MHDVDIIADHGSLANSNSCRMIQCNPSAEVSAGVNVDAEDIRSLALQEARDGLAVPTLLGPVMVGDARAHDRLQPLVEEVDRE
eukprot:CAMPEP_0181200512 /NCGR_PEP_ID=MMETSP1096-20121128/17807_1 /TAXON_ID=156174 ORGANISM="Chrysochromulina ericina, Strain CCMP281" /NCGR_SAMPLE_ID=MMETSP1096 /ASSEMBLY_ACC=CAM_ASM_000453 /LENGTH=83 /DNA_ID=CAMNT_0023290881 /DNA_START=427 /DNA_END=678 /DNA_ORIENTATION=-